MANKRKKATYKGTVLSEFTIKGETYKKGAIYITDKKRRLDDLINLNKIIK